MSNNGYVKKLRSQRARYLKQHHLSAFLILDTVADHAKRKIDEGNSLLEIGEAIITHKLCGLSSRQFDTGIKFLEAEKDVKVIHRGRKDKNSILMKRINESRKSNANQPGSSPQIKTQINGTVLKLLSSDIYDINPEVAANQNATQTQINPVVQRKQTRNKEDKNIKNSSSFIHKPINGVGGAPSSGNDQNASSDNVCSIPSAAAAFSKSLENVDIPPADKKFLTEKYTDADIADAVKYSKQVVIKTTLAQILKWYCGEENKPQVVDPEWAKEYALKFESWKSRGWHIETLSKHVEFICAGQAPPITISYSEKDFKERFDKTIKNKGFKENG